MAAWIAAMMLLPVLPERCGANQPKMLEIEAGWYAPVSSDQPGIPVRATHHLFTRRVGSPGYGRGSSQGQKGAALAV